MDMLWVRNAQFGVISICQYIVLQWVVEDNTGKCNVAPDLRGLSTRMKGSMRARAISITVAWSVP